MAWCVKLYVQIDAISVQAYNAKVYNARKATTHHEKYTMTLQCMDLGYLFTTQLLGIVFQCFMDAVLLIVLVAVEDSTASFIF